MNTRRGVDTPRESTCGWSCLDGTNLRTRKIRSEEPTLVNPVGEGAGYEHAACHAQRRNHDEWSTPESLHQPDVAQRHREAYDANEDRRVVGVEAGADFFEKGDRVKQNHVGATELLKYKQPQENEKGFVSGRF